VTVEIVAIGLAKGLANEKVLSTVPPMGGATPLVALEVPAAGGRERVRGARRAFESPRQRCASFERPYERTVATNSTAPGALERAAPGHKKARDPLREGAANEFSALRVFRRGPSKIADAREAASEKAPSHVFIADQVPPELPEPPPAHGEMAQAPLRQRRIGASCALGIRHVTVGWLAAHAVFLAFLLCTPAHLLLDKDAHAGEPSPYQLKKPRGHAHQEPPVS